MNHPDYVDGRKVTKPEDVPTTPHLQVFVYEQVHADDGWGGSSPVSFPVIYIFTEQRDAEAWIGRYMNTNHGKAVWCQRSQGRAEVKTTTTIVMGV